MNNTTAMAIVRRSTDSIGGRAVFLSTVLIVLLAVSSRTPAAPAQLVSNGAIIEFEDAITTVTNFVRTGDHIDLALGTTIDANGIFLDLIRMQILDVGGPVITMAQTITNLGTAPWEEWVEIPADIVNPVTVPSGFTPVSWAAFDTIPAGGSGLSVVDVLGLPALLYTLPAPLATGESFMLAKMLAYGGALNDPLAGVQILALGAALPLPPAVWLLGGALIGLLGIARTRRAPGFRGLALS